MGVSKTVTGVGEGMGVGGTAVGVHVGVGAVGHIVAVAVGGGGFVGEAMGVAVALGKKVAIGVKVGGMVVWVGTAVVAVTEVDGRVTDIGSVAGVQANKQKPPNKEMSKRRYFIINLTPYLSSRKLLSV